MAAVAGLDPRTPVLVGGGQISNRVDQGAVVLEPVDLIVEAARRAATDTGVADDAGVLAAVDAVRVAHILSWPYRDPAALVAERIGAGGCRLTGAATVGGNGPQLLVNRTCLDIAAGRLDVALIGGAEAWRSRAAARAAGTRPGWTRQADTVVPDEVIGDEVAMVGPAEVACGVVMPVQIYPLFESALRAAAGRRPADHVAHIAGLWSRCSAVAAANPHAWVQQAYTAEELAGAEVGGRMIGLPYRKRLNANNAVEQGAAVLLCSAEAASRLGVPRDRWVFPLAGTDAADAATVSGRTDLCSSPAIAVAGRRVLRLAGVGVDDLDAVDLYSCFPSAVQLAAAELGLPVDDPARPLTVTGGLSFAGGPWNNYVTHAVATMLGVLRERGGAGRAIGLVTANGGFATKHSFGVYATEPPAGGFRWERPQREVDLRIRAPGVVDDPNGGAGPAIVEAYTVMHDRDDTPETAIVVARVPDGRRAWATSSDPAVRTAMVEGEWVGRTVELLGGGGLAV